MSIAENWSPYSSSISLNPLLNASEHNCPLHKIYYDSLLTDTRRSRTLLSKDYDLVFLVGKRRYYAQSALLFDLCRSIKNLLVDEKSSTMKYTCLLKRTKHRGLELLLTYIYTRRLILNSCTITDLFLAAYELDVEHILQQCIQFMNESIQKMYDDSENLSLIWSYGKCCQLLRTIHHELYDRVIQAMKYFYPRIIFHKHFLSLTPNDMIHIFESLFPNDIPTATLHRSLHDWGRHKDQSNRQIIVEYLISKYLSSSNKFVNMENKISELIDHQKLILRSLDDSIVEINNRKSLELTQPFNDLNDLIEKGSESCNEQAKWLTESVETIDSRGAAHRYLRNIDHESITAIAICCTLKRHLKDINRDFHEALHRFRQVESTKQKYSFIHMGEHIYAIGEYKTKTLKFNIMSHEIQSIDGPYPGRSQSGLATTINRFLLIGGLTNEGKAVSSSIFYDCKREQWYSLPDLPLQNKYGVFLSGACFITSNNVIVVGGLVMTSEGPIAMRRCFRLNIHKGKWLTMTSCREARGQPIVSYHDNIVYLAGGFQYIYDQYNRMKSINVISIEQYDTRTNQWTILTTIEQLKYQKNLYCTTNAILVGVDKKDRQWSYDLLKQRLTCNLGLSA